MKLMKKIKNSYLEIIEEIENSDSETVSSKKIWIYIVDAIIYLIIVLSYLC